MNGTATAWLKNLILGSVFVVLWSSASSATKIGLLTNQPLVLSIARFAVASFLMLGIAHGLLRVPLPKGKGLWIQLAVYGILNVGIYLGLYVFAMQDVSAGIGSLFIAINPVLILIISSIWFGQIISRWTVLSFLCCILGLLVAAYPHFEESYVTKQGLIVLFLSNISYSLAAIYFSKKNWQGLHILAINGWQTLFGGIFLAPLTYLYFQENQNTFDTNFWIAVLWLAIPTSIFAVLIWIYMLRENATQASAWLFLCPIAGFIIASLTLNEPISSFTIMGLSLVIAGLFIVQRQKSKTLATKH